MGSTLTIERSNINKQSVHWDIEVKGETRERVIMNYQLVEQQPQQMQPQVMVDIPGMCILVNIDRRRM